MGSPLNNEALEDVAQDTAAAIWRKLDQYQGLAPLESWAYRFCFLELMTQLRKLHRLPQSLDELPITEGERALSIDQENVVEYDFVYHSLIELGPPESEIVTLRHFQELSFEEIAARLKTSASMAKSRYYPCSSEIAQVANAWHGTHRTLSYPITGAL